MLEAYFTKKEIAKELGIPVKAVKDLLEDKMEFQKADIDKLLKKMIEKLSVAF